MININDFKTWFELLANKSGKGDYISPSRFNQLVEQSLWTWTMRKYGNEQEYQPGRPIPRISFELTQDVIDSLRHLKEEREFYISNGQVPVPDGQTVKDNTNTVIPAYLHWIAMYNYYTLADNSFTEREIKLLRSNEVNRRVNSVINTPEQKRPVAEMRATYFKIWPSDVQMVRFEYLRHPASPEWAYTTVNGRPVYDEENSTDIDAPLEAMNEITMIALSYIGINMREPELIQYAEAMKDKGI